MRPIYAWPHQVNFQSSLGLPMPRGRFQEDGLPEDPEDRGREDAVVAESAGVFQDGSPVDASGVVGRCLWPVAAFQSLEARCLETLVAAPLPAALLPCPGDSGQGCGQLVCAAHT